MPDLSKLSDADLEAISKGDMAKVSDAGLSHLAGEQSDLPNWMNQGRPTLNTPESGYLTNYARGVKSAGTSLLEAIAQHPLKSLATSPFAALEPVAGFVGNTIADASAVVHSGIDKIPGSSYIGNFDPNATFAQRKAEYEQGIGKYTNPQTELGKNFTNSLGAALKPVGDVIGLGGKATGGAASYFGASPEDAKSIEEQTNAITNALLLAKSMRRNPEPSQQEAVPSKAELKQQAQDAYTRAKDAGAVVTPESFAKTLGDTKANLIDEGLNSKLTPNTAAALEHLSSHEGPLTIKQLDTYRKVAKAAESSSLDNPADMRLASKLVDSIDNYAESLSSKDIIAGDAKAAVSALNDARGLWSRYRKTDVIDEAMRRAEIRAPQFSGSGLENSIRTEFRQIAMNNKKMKGFTQAEQQAIIRVAKGGPLENSLRMLGKAAPTGIVSAALGSGAGFAAGGPFGAVALPVAGGAARLAAKRMTLGNASAAQQLMRGGPAYLPPASGPFFPNISPFLPAAVSLGQQKEPLYGLLGNQ